MEHLHYQMTLNSGDVLEVSLDHAANVLLLDPLNYSCYTSSQPFRYYGGYADISPYRLPAPHSGQWHLAVDLGGGAGSVRASVQIVSASPRSNNEPVLR